MDAPKQGENCRARSADALDAELRRTVSLYFFEPRAERLRAVAGLLSAEPDELFRQGMLIMEVADAALDDEGRQLTALFARKGRPIVCRPGCCGCCCQLVLCQPFEAALIVSYLSDRPAVLRAFAASYPRWDTATVSFRGRYLNWAQRRYGEGIDDGACRVEDYRVRCPFLDAADRCLIYPVRPYCCRSSISLDPACALPPSGEPSGLRNTPFSLYTPHHEARRAVVDLLRKGLKETAAPIPMPEQVHRMLSEHFGRAALESVRF